MGWPMPEVFRETAERLKIRWPETDEAELTSAGNKFIETDFAFRHSQIAVNHDTRDMLANNDSEALRAFESFRDGLASSQDVRGEPSHMTAAAKAAARIGRGYVAASGIVVALKVTVAFQLACATFAMGVALTVLKTVGIAGAPQVWNWCMDQFQQAKTAVTEAYATAVKRLDSVLAPAEKVEYAAVRTPVLQARPADRNREGAGGTSASGLGPQATGAQAEGIDYTRRWADGTPSLEDKHGVQDFGGHVPYGGSPLAQAVIDQRRKDQQHRKTLSPGDPEWKAINKPGTRNYAAVQLQSGEVIVRRSARQEAGGDSEQQLDAELKRRGLDGLKDPKVQALYTERQPCQDICQPLSDPTRTTWTFPWNPKDKQPKSIAKVIKERT